MSTTEQETASGSMLGRLLEGVSWERAASYREGGRGRENVLSAEVLLALDYLPRNHFLGAVIRAAHGAKGGRMLLASEIEEAALDFLPGDLPLPTEMVTGRQVHTQPDALLTSPGVFVLVEAKRIRTSAFQPKQLAREYVATLAHANGRAPVIFLLGVKPPVLVKGNGRMSIEAAVTAQLGPVVAESGNHQLVPDKLLAAIDDVFCWISWEEIDTVIRGQSATFTAGDASVQASVQRLAASITSAIAWHA